MDISRLENLSRIPVTGCDGARARIVSRSQSVLKVQALASGCERCAQGRGCGLGVLTPEHKQVNLHLQPHTAVHNGLPPDLLPGVVLRMELPTVLLSRYILWVLFVPALLLMLMSFAGQWAGNLTPLGPVYGALIGVAVALAIGAFFARYTGFRLSAGVTDPVISCCVDNLSDDRVFNARIVAQELT